MTDFDNTEKQAEISTFVMNYYKLRSFIYDKVFKYGNSINRLLHLTINIYLDKEKYHNTAVNC